LLRPKTLQPKIGREHIKNELEEIDEIIQEVLKEISKNEIPLNKFTKK
jgi:hypothetical protein